MIKKFYRFAKSLDKRIKFLFVGGLNTIIGYGVNALILFLVFSIPLDAITKATDIQALISTTTGHIAGMTNAYFWNKYFTFENREKSLTQISKFILISIAQLALTYSLMMLFQNVVGMGIYPAQGVTLIITTVFSYIGHNYITFRRTEGGIPDTNKRSI